MEALSWIIMIQLFTILGIIVVKEYLTWKGKKPIAGNPHMPSGTKSGDVDAQYWMRQFDSLSAKQDKLLDSMNGMRNDFSTLSTVIKERLPRP